MHFTKKKFSEKRSDLIKALQTKKLLRFPGAYNPLCAKLIAEIGFDGVYVSGGVMSNDLGLPDIGLTTLDQVSYRSNQIARVTDLPTIVDILALKYPFPIIKAPIPTSRNSSDSPNIKNSPIAIKTAPSTTAYR